VSTGRVLTAAGGSGVGSSLRTRSCRAYPTVSSVVIAMSRSCGPLAEAAEDGGAVLVMGEPGVGKSALLNVVAGTRGVTGCGCFVLPGRSSRLL
jgi:ABC-type sulfate/molybdate transport systems ATPase subunit